MVLRTFLLSSYLTPLFLLGINLKSWPVHGLYQPDAIKYVVVDDHEYIITANEGEEKEYKKPDFPFEFSDGQPGKYFVENDLLDDSVHNNIRDALVDESQMGKLICFL